MPSSRLAMREIPPASVVTLNSRVLCISGDASTRTPSASTLAATGTVYEKVPVASSKLGTTCLESNTVTSARGSHPLLAAGDKNSLATSKPPTAPPAAAVKNPWTTALGVAPGSGPRRIGRPAFGWDTSESPGLTGPEFGIAVQAATAKQTTAATRRRFIAPAPRR